MKTLPRHLWRSVVGRTLLLGGLLLGTGIATPTASAQRGGRTAPAATEGLTVTDTTIGLRLKIVSSRGADIIVIDKIHAGTRSAQMELKTGDVLTHINDQPVNSLEQASQLIEAWTTNQDGALSLLLSRGKAKLKFFLYPLRETANSARPVRPPLPGSEGRTAAGRGAPAAAATQVQNAKREAVRGRRFAASQQPVTLARGDLTDPWTIPGLAPRSADRTGINVLRRVFIDPATGELAFAGVYDPAFATGPIDYSTLLHDALRSPAPSFSLEPTAASKAAGAAFVRQFDQQMQTNLSDLAAGKAWLLGIFNQLLTNPNLEADRRRFVARGVELLGASADEIPGCVRGMLGQAPAGSPEWALFWSYCYTKLGSLGGATFVRAGAANDSAGLSIALDLLGVLPTINSIRQQKQSGALSESQAQAQAEVAIWGAIFRNCGVPSQRWQSAGDRAGRSGDITAFRAVADEVNANLVRERIIEPWLNGLVLSESFLQAQHRMPALEVAPVFLDGLAPTSELARTFLAADWTLKTLGTTPELATRVPGHVTPSQFSARLEAERDVHELGDLSVRFWLVPEAVPLSAAPDGSVIAFGDARPGVRARIMSHDRCNSTAARRLAEDAMQGYAAMLTTRYADYARALPELHRLREAAKILALVRWAQARGTKLAPPFPPAPVAPLPAQFQRGFWTGNFDSSGGRTFFGLVAIGGVDFGPDAGNGWVQAGIDPALKTSAAGQLLASAGLGRAAVDAAAKGDLESARALADQSARAMTGDFDFTGHPALVGIPEASPPSPVDAVLLQGEMLAQTRQNIDLMERAQKILRQTGVGDLPRAEALEQWNRGEGNLKQLQTLATIREFPLPTRQVVQLLRNGDWNQLPKPPPVAAAPAAPPAKPRPAVDPEERARIRGEITQLRTELCRIQTQLRRFNATIQSDLDQRAEWEKVTNDAYESALKRAQEKFEEFSVDFPGDILKEKLATVTDPAERAKIERALRLVDRFKDAYTTRDFSDWASKEEFTREEIVEGIKQIMEICEVEKRIKDYLEKKWGLKRAIAFYEAADDLVTSAYDVSAEVIAWRRLKQLNRNSDDFLKATEASGRRLRELIAAIHEREIRLGLDPGSTKEPCAAP
ncbi:MAG: hypothetical protein KF715_03690 [Candidatus Didemnitutus sp.]|nr:hypothetical protein [Candidatus Didemnitutus sp.]